MVRRWRIAPGEALIIALLALATVLIFGLEVRYQLYDSVALSDYTAHLQFARDMLAGKFAATHVMYETIILGLRVVLPISYADAGWITATGFYLLTALVLYGFIRSASGGNGWRVWLIAAFFALALLVVTPITLLTFRQHTLYFGYVGINVVHNPTMVLLKPFALLLFSFTVAFLTRRVPLTARTVALAYLLIALSLFAKPNFVLILLPALLVLAAYRFYRRDSLRPMILTLILPMTALLALQYVATYLLIASDGSQITFAPLATLYIYDHSRFSLLIKFALSITFPVAVYLLYARQAVRSLVLNLAWLAFAAGGGQMYLFAESGARLRDSNFWWSAQIGLFVLFVVSVLFLLERLRAQKDGRIWLCLLIFALHLASGIVYLLLQLQVVSLFDWL
jgi:hypothetical protein